ncbi:MAG: SpoIIE family protein phosphatase [Polaromonas sp.]|nr:SpoIIE family protein phosphatase [Polaromonas sp.]
MANAPTPFVADKPSDRRRRGLTAGLLEPSARLSGLLSFSGKYMLIGVIVVLALGTLSVPLWQTLRHERAVAERERLGLHELLSFSGLLADLVEMRDEATRSSLPKPDLTALDAKVQALAMQSESRPASALASSRLRDGWQLIRGLTPSDGAAQRFAAFNVVINAVLAWIQISAQEHRLNVDPELDATLHALTIRLPLVLDTVGKHGTALALPPEEFAPFVFTAQVVLTEALPVLADAMAQLQSVRPAAASLTPLLQALQQSVVAQQDAADKMQDGQQAGPEVHALSRVNQQRSLGFMQALNRAADDHLQFRIKSLERSQWIVSSLLVGALAVIAYLFAGIYVSTLRSLNSLSKGTDEFCAGRLYTRISIDTRDELVVIARNFNTMAGEFERLLGVIKEQNESREQELSRQVQARTAELAQTNTQLIAAGRRVQDELALARDMQLALLPQQFPSAGDWKVHAIMKPALELGGDFYDFLTLPDQRIGVLVADVSGKGVAAAFFMAVSRTVLLDLAATGRSPAEVMALGNDMLCQRNPMELFVTVCYVVFDPGTGSIEYASAGHPTPLRRGADGRVSALPTNFDTALAVMPGLSYVTLHEKLEAGETLLLYTDGVTEAFDRTGEAFGDLRLHNWFAQSRADRDADAIVDDLVSEVHAFVSGAQASDDLTCLVLNRQPGERTMTVPPTSVTMTNKVLLQEFSLPTRLSEIERLADAVSAALPDRPDLAFAANLCLEELITNIITHGLHGATDRIIQIRLSMSDEWLEIVLKDDAPPFDPFKEVPDPDFDMALEDRPIGGLGVHLVKTLMDDAHAHYDGSGNLIVMLKTTRQPDRRTSDADNTNNLS